MQASPCIDFYHLQREQYLLSTLHRQGQSMGCNLKSQTVLVGTGSPVQRYHFRGKCKTQISLFFLFNKQHFRQKYF